MNENRYRSENIDKLIESFSKAQGTYKTPVLDSSTPKGLYASLRAILNAVRESLAGNGLAFYQHIETQEDGAQLLVSTLSHSTGQYIASCVRVVSGKTDRRTGNILEIHKRLQALMLLGIAASANDPIAFDDNGEEISEENVMEKLRKPTGTTPTIVDKNDTISKDQYDELMIELADEPDLAKDIMESYGIETLADMPREEYHRARARILKIKKNLKEYLNRRS